MKTKPSDKLNDQHREFCRLVVSGMSHRRAYMQVFGCKVDVASACATKLVKRAYIAEELSRLREKARDRERKRDDKAIGDRESRMQMLWRMAQSSEESGNVNDAVRCLAEMNRMDGAYEPARVELGSVEEVRRAVLEQTGLEPMVRDSV